MKLGIWLAIAAVAAVGVAGYYVFMTLAAPGTAIDSNVENTGRLLLGTVLKGNLL